jgi:glutathionylspermidine synthase
VRYQPLFNLREFDDNHPVLGSWIVDGEAAGIGIRKAA